MHVDTTIDGTQLDCEFVEIAAEIFGLLADATRVRIVLALHAGELPVNEIAELVGRSPAAVSQHLAKLRWAKIVLVRKDGNRMFYRLSDEHAHRLVIEAIKQAEHAVSDTPRHHA